MGDKAITEPWSFNSSSFEFTKDLPIDSSAWSGHYFFAYDLVVNTKPEIIVELGTHKGNSLFSFAQAIKDKNFKTELHAVDTWEGDEHAGFYGDNIYQSFIKIKDKYYKDIHITPHKMFFDDAVGKFKNDSIDILHIDGLHTYKAVKHDFEKWLPKVKKDSGIILFHDVCEKTDDFGVYKLWDELKSKYKTVTFEHYHGLGVLMLNSNQVYEKFTPEELWPKNYANLSLIQDLNREILDKETHIENIKNENLEKLKVIKILTQENTRIKQELTILNRTYNDLMNSFNLLKEEVEKFGYINKSKVWKAYSLYKKFTKYFKNFFINIYRDGPEKTLRRIYERIHNYLMYKKQLHIEKDRYKYWVKNNKIRYKDIKSIKEEIENLEYKPLISIIMPVYNVKVIWLFKAVQSIKKQVYKNWELCIADDASTNKLLRLYLHFLSKRSRIKVVFREENGHISEASNSAIMVADGEYISLMDNDDIIYPHALAEVVKVLNKKPKTDLIYSDEDKLSRLGKRVDPFFKPDWSPDLFMSSNYLCHFTTIRKSLVDEVGRFRKGYEGSQDYDLFLRVTEKTDNIEHIPDILYSWRKIPGSTAAVYSDKNYAENASIKALEDALKRRKLDATVQQGLFPGSFRVKYDIKGNPLVSILIPTKDKYEYIERCVSSLLEKTTYSNYELIIIDTGSTDENVLQYYKTLEQEPRISFLHWNKRFNYSAVNNYGVENAKGEYILLLNNDTEVITPDWIEGMLGHAQRKEIGAVGVKLYYPNDTIQHAGVVLGIGGPTKDKSIAHHIMRTFPKSITGIPYTKDLIRNYSAVTAACLMVEKTKYTEVNGLEEKFRIAFNDVDFCLKLGEKGYYNLYTPYVELYHHESVSVGTPEKNTRNMFEMSNEVNLMIKNWSKIIKNDPMYNTHYDWRGTNVVVKID